ncbi:MAG: hypothetical protein ABSB50_05620 [Terracidiphilus sp.]
MKPTLSFSLAAILLLASGRVSKAQATTDADNSPHAAPVSIVTLLAQSASHKTKRVQVSGFMVLDFEGERLYLHEEDYQVGLYMNSLYLALSPAQREQYKAMDKHYVTLEAFFHGRRSAEDDFAGELWDVREVTVMNRRSDSRR